MTTGAISAATASMICGFTARITTSASAHQRRVVGVRPGCRTAGSSSLSASGPHVGREDHVRRHELGREEPLDERLAHVAGAEEADGAPLIAHTPSSRRARAEDRRADPDHRRAFLDRHLEVAAHAHRQLAQPVLARRARAARGTRRASRRPRSPSGGNRHEPPHPHVGSAADRLEQRARPPSGARRPCDASPPTFTCQQRLDRRGRAARARLSSSLRQIEPVERLDDVEQRERVARPCSSAGGR